MMTIRLTTLLALITTAVARAADPVVVPVFEGAEIQWDEDSPEAEDTDGFVLRFAGQTVRNTVRLPPPPAKAADTPLITATVTVVPITSIHDGHVLPNDSWPRLGSVTVIAPGPDGRATQVELMRFITGYGAGGTYEQDVSALAPLLRGTRTFELFLNSFSDRPGWRVSLRLTFDDRPAGYRRPTLASPLFNDRHVTAEINRRRGRVTAAVEVPAGLARPRLRIITTGHASDGQGANEFATSTHVLRVDGREVLRWRPWAEGGPGLRARNPRAGRQVIGGRQVWSSDFDRAGWSPGLAVEPLMVPLPELTPGRHVIELEIDGIRPAVDTEATGHGYWIVSAVVVADERLAPAPPAGSN